MTQGELLNYVEASARNYGPKAHAGIIRAGERMYELTAKDIAWMKAHKKRHGRLVYAVLAGFLNHMAFEMGGDRGERVEHLKQ